MKPALKRDLRYLALFAVIVIASIWPASTLAVVPPGEGVDLEFGGSGTGNGKFSSLKSIGFDSKNQIYVLDGCQYEVGRDRAQQPGNLLVQKFSADGQFLSQFSVRDEQLGEKNDPERMAIASNGDIFVTQPEVGVVQHFDSNGKLRGNIPVANALAICHRVVGGTDDVVVAGAMWKQNTWVPCDSLTVISASGTVGKPIHLSPPVLGCFDLTCDRKGNFYFQAVINQIYKYEATGKLVAVIGGGTDLRLDDGSELVRRVAVDSTGNIYGATFGNPALITRFDPQITNITQRGGQFHYADPWAEGGDCGPLVIDQHDRLWVGVDGAQPGGPNAATYHFRPAVVRTTEDFLDATKHKSEVRTHSALAMGLNMSLESKLAYNVGYALQPTTISFVVKAGYRRVHHLSAHWDIFDMYKNTIATGNIDLPLQDGKEARESLPFTPKRWGWYTVAVVATEGRESLASVGANFGFTQTFDKMEKLLPGESAGGWVDPARQAFAGLPLMRIGVNQGNDVMERAIAGAAKYGNTVFGQFTDKKDCTPEIVTAAVTRFKGRIPVWEVMNEPNFSMSPMDYVALLKELYPIIKGIDPAAKVMGPDVCGIQLGWYDQFYKFGGQAYTDILSVHDYEGNETIDPNFWPWKYKELRKLMAQNGDGDKPIWQTERAITGVRQSLFLGPEQAIEVTLHQDVLESLGIPNEHDNLYYLNANGYVQVPSYLWSPDGPHPAALATRTRQAMIRGRQFQGPVDFGPSGNKMFLALRYSSTDGSTIILRNFGMADYPMNIGLAGADSLEVADLFGNRTTVRAVDGHCQIPASVTPTYLFTRPGETLTFPTFDFGPDLALAAKVSFSGKNDGKIAFLNNGVLETAYEGDPLRDKLFAGDLGPTPPVLDIRLPHAEQVDRVIVYGLRADNAFCALLDYDLQAFSGSNWVALQTVHTPCPETNLEATPNYKAATWYMDTNLFLNEFGPVMTDHLRLIPRRATWGYMPDEAATKAAGTIGNVPQLMLKEVEIYGPTGTQEVH